MTDNRTTERVDHPPRVREAIDELMREKDATDNRTTELCKLLDERGIEWKDGDAAYEIEWSTPDGRHCSAMYWKPAFTVLVSGCTPEQAIAATLGRPKVKKVRGMTYDEHGGEVYFLACSGCGDWVDGDLDCIGEYDGPNFCHNCGGEFDGPLMCKVCGELADMEFGDMCVECYWHEGEGNDER